MKTDIFVSFVNGESIIIQNDTEEKAEALFIHFDALMSSSQRVLKYNDVIYNLDHIVLVELREPLNTNTPPMSSDFKDMI